jgi:hypothetical protein
MPFKSFLKRSITKDERFERVRLKCLAARGPVAGTVELRWTPGSGLQN